MPIRRIITSVLLTAMISSCSTTTLKELPNQELTENDGYLALVFDSLDTLNSIYIQGVSTGTSSIHISSIPKGRSLLVYKIPEGQYCLRKFNAYDLKITYDDNGVCFFVEQGELNYPGHLVIRNPVTTIEMRERDLLIRMNREYPNLCSKFYSDGCG